MGHGIAVCRGRQVNSASPRSLRRIAIRMTSPDNAGEMTNWREELAILARGLPEEPGVYLMKDQDASVLYIGKAGSLRSRVGSYFTPSADLGPWKQGMLPLIRDVETISCDTEWEALLLEARLIKDYRPKYNTLQLDDKTYPYLVVTTREDFPAVFITRNPADARYRGGRILGPFTSSGPLKEAVYLLQSVFKFRTCTLCIREGDPANRRFRPCLLHAIDRCTAPCGDRIEKSTYRKDIDGFLRFLSTRRAAMRRSLQEDMEAASANREYERAATLRDQLRAIEKLDDRARPNDPWQPEVTIFATDPDKSMQALQRALNTQDELRCIEAIDIAHLQGGETVGSKVCFVDGRPFKDGYRQYRIRTTGNDDYAAIREVVARRYRDAGKGLELFPDLILIDGGLGQLHAAMAAFSGLSHQPPLVASLAKREELIYLQGNPEPIRLGRENPGLRLLQAIRDEAHRFAQRYHHLLRRKRVLGEDEGC